MSTFREMKISSKKNECNEVLEQIIIRQSKSNKWKKYYLISIFFDEKIGNNIDIYYRILNLQDILFWRKNLCF